MTTRIGQKFHSFNDNCLKPIGKFYSVKIHPTLKVIAEKVLQIAKITLIVGVSVAIYYTHPAFAFYAFALGLLAPSLVYSAQKNFMRVWNGKIWGDNSSQAQTTDKTKKLWMLNRAVILAGIGFGYVLNVAPATTCTAIFWFASLGARLHGPFPDSSDTNVQG